MSQKYCTWNMDRYDEMYETDCKHAFFFVDSLLDDDPDFKWCPYCGREVDDLTDKENAPDDNS